MSGGWLTGTVCVTHAPSAIRWREKAVGSATGPVGWSDLIVNEVWRYVLGAVVSTVPANPAVIGRWTWPATTRTTFLCALITVARSAPSASRMLSRKGIPTATGGWWTATRAAVSRAPGEHPVQPAQLFCAEPAAETARVERVQRHEGRVGGLDRVRGPVGPVEVAGAGERVQQWVAIVVVTRHHVHRHGNRVEHLPQQLVLLGPPVLDQVTGDQDAVRTRIQRQRPPERLLQPEDGLGGRRPGHDVWIAELCDEHRPPFRTVDPDPALRLQWTRPAPGSC